MDVVRKSQEGHNIIYQQVFPAKFAINLICKKDIRAMEVNENESTNLPLVIVLYPNNKL